MVGLLWDDICRLELPIPPIEKQFEIVNSYKAITERIALKQKINDNLEAQAMLYFHHQHQILQIYNQSITLERLLLEKHHQHQLLNIMVMIFRL